MIPETAVGRRERVRQWIGGRIAALHAYSVLHPVRARIAAAVMLVSLLLIVGLGVLLSPPSTFPSSALIELPSDEYARGFGKVLAANGIIRSPVVFEALARLSGNDRELQSGVYVFDEPVSAITVLYRIANGKSGIEPMRVTLTEGMAVRNMADALQAQLPGFSSEAFLAAASTSEGYLFPETYFILPGTPEEEIVTRLRTQFSAAIEEVTPQIIASPRSFSDVVIMASLLEREAQTLEDKRIIAGILWKRVDEGMPLQVDAVFGYILGRDGHAPTFDDLEIDSPYNTYQNEGLPPGPIANPGLESLLAALTPIETEYFFYLTGRDGSMYYASDFDGHRENRRLYLD